MEIIRYFCQHRGCVTTSVGRRIDPAVSPWHVEQGNMTNTRLAKGTIGWGALVLAGLAVAPACVPGLEDADDGPLDGGAAVGDGGSGGGGGDPSTGGSSYYCNEELTGTGGAIYLFNCPEWLGERDGGDSTGALDVTCVGSGEGGQGGATAALPVLPALRRVCENPSKPSFTSVHPVYFCLEPLIDSPCADDHEAKVLECLTQEAPCGQDLSGIGCTALMNDCPELEGSVCFWGMAAAYEPDYIARCMGEPRAGEECDDRFVRCAWGL